MARQPSQIQASNVTYELHSLGWKAFQDLCASITAEVLGQSFQVFLPTKDGGRDGAFHGKWKAGETEVYSGSFTVQCKFTSRQDNALAAIDLDDELKKAERLAAQDLADTYILMTNHAVSGTVKEHIRARFLQIKGIRNFLLFGKTWIDQKIRESTRLRMMVPRVYGLGDLSQILDERAYNQATDILSSLGDDLATFVITDAHRKSVQAIVQKGFVLLLGEPASGKSTIAASLALGAINAWDCSTIKVRNPDEFVQHWNPQEPNRFFWVDDAFGATQYQWELAAGWNNALPHMKAAVKKGAKVVFTSRDYIYRTAKHDLKASAFPLLVDSQVVINVQRLSKTEREQILYNHIKLGNQSKEFKAAVKPHLPAIASHHDFRPEIARRLGDRFFTHDLPTYRAELLKFVAEPVAFLKDILESLDSDNRAAIAVIFMNGGNIDSPVELTPKLQNAVEMLGASASGVRDALSALEGSLTKLVRSEGRTSWTFRHPTIGDAFAEVVAANPELLDIYLHGAKIEKLVQEVVAGVVPMEGAKVVIPTSRFAELANRLNLELPIDHICRFLGSRCSRVFLEFYFKQCPNVLEYVCSPHSYLHATLQTELIPKLQQYGLLPMEQRQKLIKTITELAVTVPDADFLTIDRVKQVFTAEELLGIVSAVRTQVIPKLWDIVSDWRFNYDSSNEPEEYFELLAEPLRAYREEFGDDPEAIFMIAECLQQVRDYIGELEEEYPRREEDWDSDMRSSLSSLVADRTIFDDIDA